MQPDVDDLPPTTARILADKALMRTCGQECVDWALGMLDQGHDGEAFCVLACMSPPYNHFEMAELRDKALSSLNLGDIQLSEALWGYAKETMKATIKGEKDVGSALNLLRILYFEGGFLQELQDSYLLYYAYMDLQESEYQYYWDGATRDNINQIVLQHFTSCLTEDSPMIQRTQSIPGKWISYLWGICKRLKIS
ncbi:hypothetical protein [Estrella lausannensis]|uniref:Uncharacterized protein n=1 Tax=Estrella lausannensis TaxID=483423 RepID=A0A0H5DPR3_9BACT|nr:hypothetical protein [Estrella lausannensis]CRX38457.1 hypothetical protein ELAC_1114 [Estrella lausannensis]